MEPKDEFEIYLEKYMRSYKVTREEALKHKLVQYVKEYYESKKGGDT